MKNVFTSTTTLNPLAHQRFSREQPTVMVCGYFDGMHEGHTRFLEKASKYGKVFVGVAKDKRLQAIKNTFPLHHEDDRLHAVQASKYVHKAFLLNQIDGPHGIVWENELIKESPTYFIVNDDIPEQWIQHQKQICEKHNIKFLIHQRDSAPNQKPISSTQLRNQIYPYRVCLTTGMDQVQLSSISRGLCIGFSIQPTQIFADRCGMATSTRKSLMHAFGAQGISKHLSPEEQAKIAFAIDNPPKDPTGVTNTFPYGSFAPRYITGAIDPITILIPGISKLEYSGKPWPKITTLNDPQTLQWLQAIITLEKVKPRPQGEHFALTDDPKQIKKFAQSTYPIWDAILARNTNQLIETVNAAHDQWVKVCLYADHNGMRERILELRNQNIGTCIQGAGNGGYIACISNNPANRIPIKIRKPKTNH